MNAVTAAPSPRSPRRVWRWILLGFALCVLALAFEVYQCVTLTSEAAALKNELMAMLSRPVQTRVQVSVGPMFCSLVRFGSRWIEQLPDDARLGIRAVRSASVGVYDVRGNSRLEKRADVFLAADRVMEKKGWTRVVGVNDAENLVLVYVPRGEPRGSFQKACVAVCNDEHLVVVSGKVAVQPLMKIVQQHTLLARR